MAADKAISRHRCPCLFVRQVSLAPPNSQPLASPPHLPRRTLLPCPPLAAQVHTCLSPPAPQQTMSVNTAFTNHPHHKCGKVAWAGYNPRLGRAGQTSCARQRKLRAQGYGRRASCGIAALPFSPPCQVWG